MEQLDFRVQVDSGDPETDRAYLRKLVEVFRGITENLASYGFTGDEIFSRSEINTRVE